MATVDEYHITNEQARKWLGKIIDTDRANCDLYPEHRLRLLGAVIHEADMAIGHSLFAQLCKLDPLPACPLGEATTVTERPDDGR